MTGDPTRPGANRRPAYSETRLQLCITRWLQLRFDFDSMGIRPGSAHQRAKATV